MIIRPNAQAFELHRESPKSTLKYHGETLMEDRLQNLFFAFDAKCGPVTQLGVNDIDSNLEYSLLISFSALRYQAKHSIPKPKNNRPRR